MDLDINFLHAIRNHELNIVLPLIGNARKKILEIGAGTGYQASQLVKAGHEVTAVDIAQTNYADTQVFPVQVYDGHHLPFPDATFDVVFSSNLLEHIPHLDSFQDEIFRTVKPGGLVIHVVPSATWRIWTMLMHYPKLGQKVLQKFDQKKPKRNGPAGECVTSTNRLSRVAGLLVQPRHGEKGNRFSEVFYFSAWYWKRILTTKEWQIVTSRSSGLFYTGNMLLGSMASIKTRCFLARFMGSSTLVFVLSKR